MLSTVLGLFTGSGRWLYIALVVCVIGLMGISWLSVELYADKASLETTICNQNKSIKEKDELINTQANEIKKLDKALTQTKEDLHIQNALNEQYAVDIKNAERKHNEIMAKKPTFKTQNNIPKRTDNTVKDLDNFITNWREVKK